VFHGDAHNSEYIAPCDERIAFISGFTGSNGVCVITQDDARMWTDGRYYLAAEKQLEAGWKMEKMEAGVKNWLDWTIDSLGKGASVGYDFSTTTYTANETRSEKFKKNEITIKSVNLVDRVWGNDRPERPTNEVKYLDLKYSGQSTKDKIAAIRKEMGDLKLMLVTALDEVAWILNMRGSDIEYNPVFFSYLIIYSEE